jgi:hypothetical protein
MLRAMTDAPAPSRRPEEPDDREDDEAKPA